MGALVLALAMAAPARATVAIGPQQPLQTFRTYSLAGDVLAAGVGMRNRGGGTIPVTLPAGATAVQAFLYWAIVSDRQPSAAGALNGKAIAGELIAQVGDPCWPTLNAANEDPPTLFTWIHRADVTGKVAASNVLTGFASGLTGGEDPAAAGSTSAYPLLDGATLVVVYAQSSGPTRNIVIADGGQTFFSGPEATTLAWGAPGAASPVSARTVYVVADGQAQFPGDGALFEGTAVAGPGGAVRTADAFDGADGGGPAVPHGLWDTLDVDVSALLAPGATAGSAGVVSGDTFDCLTWVAQVASVVTAYPATTTTTSTTTTTTLVATTTTIVGPTTTSTTTSTTSSTTTTTPSTTTTSTTTASTTTSTTSSSSTTTSTSTTVTTSTSSTTTSVPTTTSTTTTTTLPGECGEPAPTFASILCRLEELRTFIDEAPDLVRYKGLLGRRVLRAETSVREGETFQDGGVVRVANVRLRRAVRQMIGFGYRIDSLVARRIVDDQLRDALRTRVTGLRADLATLIRIVLGRQP